MATLLVRDDVSLLTLTGVGGTGKTRLAAQAAGHAADAFPAGIWWVSLAALDDAALVLPTAAQVVGAHDELATFIADKWMLLVFDNFEQVVDAADSLSALLAVCPNLKLLVTSREPLHLTAEQEYPVPPLAPAEGAELFVARARAVTPNFEPDASVPAICRRLDELPLAIELAAARVKALSSQQILERDEAAGWYERCFALGGEVSVTARARALFGVAHVSEARGDLDRMRREFEGSAELLREVGDVRWLVLALTHLAGVYTEFEPERGEHIQMEALAVAEANADLRGVAIVKGNLAALMLHTGALERAARFIQEAMDARRELDDDLGLAFSLSTLARIQLAQGDPASGAASVRESLAAFRSIGDELFQAQDLLLGAAVVLAAGDAHVAARLCAAHETFVRARGVGMDAQEVELFASTRDGARAALGDGFGAAWSEGSGLDLDESVQLALAALANAY